MRVLFPRSPRSGQRVQERPDASREFGEGDQKRHKGWGMQRRTEQVVQRTGDDRATQLLGKRTRGGSFEEVRICELLQARKGEGDAKEAPQYEEVAARRANNLADLFSKAVALVLA